MLKKTVLSLLIVCALLLCIQPISAAAAETSGTLSVGVQQNLTASENSDYVYTFTAPESGTYVIYSEADANSSIWFDIYDSAGSNVNWGSNGVLFYADANESFEIYVSLSVYSNEQINALFSLERAILHTLPIGTAQRLTAAVDSMLMYTFTASESGTYILWSEEADAYNVYFKVLNSNNRPVDSNQTRLQFTAKAGESYTIVVDIDIHAEEGASAVFGLDKGAAITSLSLDRTTYTGFIGENIRLEYTFAPINSILDVNWSSSNPAVAEFDGYYRNYAYFDLLSAGTSNITVQSANGKSATCVLTVKEPTVVYEGSSISITVPAGDRVGFSFTAPKDGFYFFERSRLPSGAEYNDMWVRVEGDGYMEEDNGGISARSTSGSSVLYGCYQGTNYFVTLENNSETSYTVTFGIHKAVPATSLTIEGGYDSVDIYKDDLCGISAEFGPAYAVPETVTWTSSNPEILEIIDQWDEYCEVYAHAEGTVTLTATSKSGLTDSVTVNITEYVEEDYEWDLSGDPITLNAPNPVVINGPDDWAVYEFVPTQSGYYSFTHDADEYAVIGVVENNKEQISGFYFEKTDGGVVLWLEAGETYHIYSYYIDINTVGTYNIYLRKIPTAYNGWVQQNDKWYYYINGDLASGWQKIDGKWYYFWHSDYFGFDNYGPMVTGWDEIDGNRYYFDNDMTTGWKQIDGFWYYFGTNGIMQTGWVKSGASWYYLDPDGIMLTGWQQIDGSWYYLGTNGTMVTGWQKVGGSWYYFSASGAMQTGWQQIGGIWYYLSSSGAMQTGWQKIDSKWYYFSSGGAMQTGWLQLNGQWYYLGNDMKTGWASIGNKWYYFSSGGVMLTGWQKVGGTWYYLNSDMQTGWQKISGSWYYFSAGGAMQTGWQKINGSWYYLGTNGVMVTGTHVIDGKQYTFSAGGVML